LQMPLPQSLDQIIVSWDGFLRSFCLADTNDVLHDGALHVDLLGLEVYILPFQCEEFAPSQAVTANNRSALSSADSQAVPVPHLGPKCPERLVALRSAGPTG